MAQDIELMGATYSAVPSVQLPKSGGGLAAFDDTSDADAVAADIAQGKTAYVGGNKVTGIVPERFSSDIAPLTPTALGGGVSAAPGIYRSAAVKRDINLVASNVRYDKTIFGVAGTFTAASTVSSGQQAATADKILSGYSAWVDGAEVLGTASSGPSVTTVEFTDESLFHATHLWYVDGAGVCQYSPTLAALSAVSYQMLSGSLIVCIHQAFDPDQEPAYMAVPTTLTRISKQSFAPNSPRYAVFVVVWQVA